MGMYKVETEQEADGCWIAEVPVVLVIPTRLGVGLTAEYRFIIG
jgi:hypothetical protein